MGDSFISARVAEYPEITALVVLVIGILAARLARSAVEHALVALDQRMARYTTSDAGVVSPAFIRFSKGLAFWLVVLFAIMLALRLLDVGELSTALDTAISFIPQLLVGLTIVGAGHFLGLASRSLIARLSDSVQPDSLAARMVHGAIVMIAVVMGLQQMNIDITFITQLVLVLVVVILGGMTLAFALGARQHVANLIAQSELQRYSIGERIRVGKDEGTILEIHRTGVDLATDEGIASIPAAHFAESRVLRLAREGDDE